MPQLAATLKAAYPRALATLIRLLRDIDVAEDTLQDALERALEVWPERGVPDNAVAWLVTTARNRAIDLSRRRRLEARQAVAIQTEMLGASPIGPPPEVITGAAIFEDDLLRLVFTCCHPALTRDAQVALTLKTVAGLSAPEIARAFLVSPTTMEQRIVRAKRKIREARIPYEVPDANELPARLDAVLAVIYLLFNEGYSASEGSKYIRTELCEEAIRLSRMLSRLFLGAPEVTGLLALVLLQHARRSARLDQKGNIVPLEEQDRSLWDQLLIAEGRALVDKALRRGRPGPYQIQAAIAAVHDEAAEADATDWAQIAELYALLERFQPSPVVTLNRAVAAAKVDGAGAALGLLQSIEDSPDIQRYHLFHATRGALLAEEGQSESAQNAFDTALSLTRNPREQAFIRRKIDALK